MDSDIALLNRELELENKELREKMVQKLNVIDELKREKEQLKEEKDNKQKEIDVLNAELISIKNGRAYKFAQKVKKIIK